LSVFLAVFLAFLLVQGGQLNQIFWASYETQQALIERSKQFEDANHLAKTQQAMIVVAQTVGNLAVCTTTSTLNRRVR